MHKFAKVFQFIPNDRRRKKQGQGNQCRTPGVKFERESKSLKIIKNQQIKRKKITKENQEKLGRNSNEANETMFQFHNLPPYVLNG